MLSLSGAVPKNSVPRPVHEDLSANQEYRLMEYAERLARYRNGRRAVHIHLSFLKQAAQRDYQLRIAANTIENIVSLYEGQLFRLVNQDLVFVFKDADPLRFDEALSRLRYVFNEDPLTGEIDPHAIEKYTTWYNLTTDYDAFLALSKRLYDDLQRRHRRLAHVRAPSPPTKAPIDPHHLGSLIEAISTADLSNFLRRQTVHAFLNGKAPQPLFQELFMSIDELHRSILPGYDLSSNRWLFQYLTETLDRRMLAHLVRNDDPEISRSYSLNLNISTILSPEFLAFDSSLKAGTRGTIILEIQAIDIFADLSAFNFARDFARDRGYRLCLDSLNEHGFALLDRVELGVDLVKLSWTPEMTDSLKPEKRQHLTQLVDRAGKSKVILCRCENEAALKFGQSVGIALFQGHYVDQLTTPRHISIKLRS